MLKSRSEGGSVLATTMVITFVIGATLAGFLVLTQHQTFANARSQSWNQSMAVAEAGVEDALQMINKFNYDNDKLLDWSTGSSVSQDQWSPYGTDAFYTIRWVGNDYRALYFVIITNRNPVAPTITAYGYLRYDYEYRPAPVTTAAAGTSSSGFQSRYLRRQVQVGTRRDALWTLAMLADKQIDLNGNRVTTDSFNSADPNASYWAPGAAYGIYDASKRNDNGDVATNLQLIDSLNAGNADIMGKVSTGPGGTVAIGPNGSVGSEAWVSSGNSGIQPGYVSDDMNVKLNDVGLPTTTWFALPSESGSGTNINGVTYKHVIRASGDYKASTLQGSVYVASGVSARVYLSDNVSLTGSQGIRLAPTVQRLILYMGGSEFKLGGSGVVNETGRAESFLYFGLPSNRSIKFQGNGDFTGAIYAPSADFVLGGGGSSNYDFIGASVTRTVTMNGSYNFHYDEDLATFGPSRGFIPTTWAEVY
jgi:hypothetical protein